MENHQLKKVGIFGGSFDPIHFGHLAIALALKEAHKLDEVLFIPANVNPKKQESVLTPAEHRLNMLKIALKDVPGCTVSTIELDREGPSYMVDTLQELKKKRAYKNCALYLLMGEDLLSQFSEWKEPHEIASLSQPLVARRHGVGFFGAWFEDPILKPIVFKGLTDTPLFDISSTDIRKRIKEDLYCGHLVDKEVLRYIKQHKLYV